nr:MAG TPA: hypothetical protein [Bacteriophage sp.]
MSCYDNREIHVLYMTLPRRKILRKEGVRNDKLCFCIRY